MFNRVILIGNITKDVDIRYTPAGTAVATMRLAVTSKCKQGDEMKEDTLFIDAVVFGRQAESCGQYLSKGSPVLVEGRLREKRWEFEGQPKSKFEVLANSVRFLPKRDRPSVSGADMGDIALPEGITELEPF